MYLDFGVKDIPVNAIRALSGDSCDNRFCACPAIPCTPYSCGTEGYYGAGDECCPPCCPCSQFDEPPDDGNPLPQSDPNNPQSDPTIPVVCDMLVLCADGTTEQACFQTFASLCTGHGGVYDPNVVYKPDGEIVESPDGFEIYSPTQTTPIFSIDTRESLPVSEGGFVSDEEYSQFDQIDELPTRCIQLYKPCPEGYIDGNPNCPNTGDCIPDPNYIAYGGLVQMQPIGQTPIAIATPTRGGAGGLVGAVDETMLRSNTTTPTTTTATSTPEEPEESGLGILALGLIALEVLAT